VEGELTIKGIAKPVTLTVTSFFCMPHPMLKKDACGANATAKIKRSEFNAGKYAPYVSDEVTLTIPVEAYKNNPIIFSRVSTCLQQTRHRQKNPLRRGSGSRQELLVVLLRQKRDPAVL